MFDNALPDLEKLRSADDSALAAAQGISHGMASSQMYLAAALRDRLPKVAQLFADGMISYRLARTIWSAPHGQTYTTHPGSRLLFPGLCLPTGELPVVPRRHAPPGKRGVMMPRRRHTREHDRARRIRAERALNIAHLAERAEPPPF